jgi:hypothetical protein
LHEVGDGGLEVVAEGFEVGVAEELGYEQGVGAVAE